MRKFLTTALLVFITLSAYGQKFSRIIPEIIVDNESIGFPDLGNLVAPQFSQIDLNRDGIQDLFIFDRSGFNILCFVKEDNGVNFNYRYAPEYNSIVPSTLHSWVKLHDFNQDGIMDIFTAPSIPGIPGIEVHRGKVDGNTISFDLITFDYGDFDILLYPINGLYVNIYNSFIDYPGIGDVDGDGDTDVLTFEVGGSTIDYYRNFAVEEGLGVDTFLMDIEDRCFGKFVEDDFNSTIVLSANPEACANRIRDTYNPRHAGSTINMIDIDNNGVQDLIIGDLSSNGVVMLYNGGDVNNAFMTRFDNNYPSYDTPVDINVFLNTFTLDLDGDGDLDMLAAPNPSNGGDLENHIWLYENVGQDSVEYTLRTSSFLVDNILNLGSSSDPAYNDIDGDGDLDLIIGVNGFRKVEGGFDSRLYLFSNETTGEQLRFRLIDDDYLGLTSINTQSGRFAPEFGDLDNDGDVDLVVGDQLGRLIYFENVAEEGAIPDYPDFVYNFMDIRVGQNAKPQVIDLDLDGLTDLVVGERNTNSQDGLLGGINFFKNIGEVGNPQFDPDPEVGGNTSVLGAVFTRDPLETVGSTSPYFFKLEEDYLLVTGTESGIMRSYGNIEDDLYARYDTLNLNILPFQVGAETTVTGGDINGNGLIDITVGSNRGGIHFFDSNIRLDGTSSNPNLEEEIAILAYPNPTYNGVVEILSEKVIEKIDVYDLQGRFLFTSFENRISLENKGLHICQAYLEGGGVANIKVVNL